jgi:hypothetical protein
MATTDALDDRFGPIFEAMDRACEPFDIRAGENLLMLTVLLVGSLAEVPPDLHGLFRSAVADTIAQKPGAFNRLRVLCVNESNGSRG